MMKKAFTLIELLVVIGIITLLAAILFPVFNQARRKSYHATCTSNLQQIGAAVQMYSQDYDGLLPWAGDPGDLHSQGWVGTPQEAEIRTFGTQHAVLLPYIKNITIWKCPADAGYDAIDGVEGTPLVARPSGFTAFGSSYISPSGITMAVLARKPVGNLSPNNDSGLAEVLYSADSVGYWHGSYGDKTHYRFVGVFLDGHVQSFTQQRYATYYYQNL